MIEELFAVIEKNFKRLMRSKTSALVVILGPLLLILLIGLAFNNTGLYGIRMGIYSKTYDTTTNDLVSRIQTKEFTIVKMSSNESCINAVKEGENHICIVFPESYETGRIVFHVDYSKINLVYSLLQILTYKVGEEGKAISLDLTKALLENIKNVADTIKENSNTIVELKANAVRLSQKLDNINSQLEQFDLNESIDPNQVQGSLNQAISNLDDFKVNVQGTKQTADHLKDNMQATVDSLNTLLSLQNCNPSDKIDLTQYLISGNAAGINTQLIGLLKPQCALIYTMYMSSSDTLSKADAISGDLYNALNDVEDARTSLLEIKRNSTSALNQTQRKLGEMKAAKQNLQTQLGEANGIIQQNLNQFDAISMQLNNLTISLGNLSFINPRNIVTPFSTEVRPLLTKKTSLDYIFPSLIVLVIMFVATLLGSTLVMREKSSKAYFRNFITPTSSGIFIIGTYLTTIIITLLQAAVVMIIASLFFKISFLSNIFVTFTVIFFVASVFAFIGIVLGYFLKSEETTTLAAIILCCILLLFSSMIIPIESMTQATAFFAKLSPFVLGEILLRRSILFNESFISMGYELLIMVAQFVVLLAISFWAYHVAKKEAEK